MPGFGNPSGKGSTRKDPRPSGSEQGVSRDPRFAPVKHRTSTHDATFTSRDAATLNMRDASAARKYKRAVLAAANETLDRLHADDSTEYEITAGLVVGLNEDKYGGLNEQDVAARAKKLDPKPLRTPREISHPHGLADLSQTRRVTKYKTTRSQAESDAFFLRRAGYETRVVEEDRGFAVHSSGTYTGNGHATRPLTLREAENLRRNLHV